MGKLSFIAACCFLAASLAFAKDKCVIFSGQNNHDWKSTTPFLKMLLEVGCGFDVEVNDSPETLDSASLKDAKLVVSNWNALGEKRWTREAFKAYEDFVKNGGGVVSVHAGTTYPGAPESYRRIGIGAWTGKTFHGRYEPFAVKVEDSGHPVMNGVKDFITRDELWSNIEFEGDYRVLANSVAIGSPYIERIFGENSKERKILQPCVVAAEIGKGRCVAIFLGHDAMAMGTPAFMDIFANAAMWSGGGEARGGLLNADNLEAAADAISTQPENGDMSIMLALEKFAFDSGESVRSKIVSVLLDRVIGGSGTAPYFKRRAWNLVANIASKPDLEKISKFDADVENAEFAKAAREKVEFAASASSGNIEFERLSAGEIGELLKGYDSLDADGRIAALAQFYYADFKPALEKAKADAGSENGALALNALRALSKLATPDEYPFYIGLLKGTRDEARKRAIKESLMCVKNDGFDAMKALAESSDENFPFYAGIAAVRDPGQTLAVAVARIRNSRADAKEILNILMPYADKGNIADIISLCGKDKGTDSALRQFLVRFLRRGGGNFEIVKSVFGKLNDAQKREVLQAMSVCAAEEMFDFAFEMANSKNAKDSEMAADALSSWCSVKNAMKIARCENIGNRKGVDVLYGILTSNANLHLKPGEILEISKILKADGDPRYADLARRLGNVLQSAKPRGSENLAAGAVCESVYKYGPDGGGGLPPAAIDGDAGTYWDEVDGRGVYGLRVSLPKREKISQIRITRYNEVWSPDGFEVFVDGKPVKKVGFAIYEENRFNLDLDAEGRVMELKIDNVPQGRSPAIRELEIY